MERNMATIIAKAAAACGLVAALAAAAPAQAQYYGYFGGPVVVVSPYGAYGYAPGYRYGYWDYPAGYDSGGAAYSYRDLGWQPGLPGGAPANPCTPGQRFQNRC
jgi:hypothetical protein